MQGHQERKKLFQDKLGQTQSDFLQRAARRLRLAFDATDSDDVRVEWQMLQEVCNWMVGQGYETGNGDTVIDLLVELESQARDGGATGA